MVSQICKHILLLKLSQIESNISIACSKNLNKCQNFSLSMDLIFHIECNHINIRCYIKLS